MTDSITQRNKKNIHLMFPYHLFNLHSHFQYKTTKTLQTSIADRRDSIANCINSLNQISAHRFKKKQRNYDELFFITFAMKYMEQKKAKNKLNKIKKPTFKGATSFSRTFSIIKPKQIAFFGLIDEYIEKIREKERKFNKTKKIKEDYEKYKRQGLIPTRNTKHYLTINSYGNSYQVYLEKNKKNPLPSIYKNNDSMTMTHRRNDKDKNKDKKIGILKIKGNSLIENNTLDLSYGNDYNVKGNYDNNLSSNINTFVRWEDEKSLSFRPGKTVSNLNDKFFLTTMNNTISSSYQVNLNTINNSNRKANNSESKGGIKLKSILRKKITDLNDIIIDK